MGEARRRMNDPGRVAPRVEPPSSGVMRVFRSLALDEPVPARVVTETILERNDFKDSPILPEWILEGAPKARSLCLAEAPDGNLGCYVWECTKGKFEWHFYADEMVHILEGEVRVREKAAALARTLRAGDVGYFPRGSVMVWEVDDYVKKLAVLRTSESIPKRLLRSIGF